MLKINEPDQEIVWNIQEHFFKDKSSRDIPIMNFTSASQSCKNHFLILVGRGKIHILLDASSGNYQNLKSVEC